MSLLSFARQLSVDENELQAKFVMAESVLDTFYNASGDVSYCVCVCMCMWVCVCVSIWCVSLTLYFM